MGSRRCVVTLDDCECLEGHEAVRELWSDYYSEVDGVVFVVDSGDVERLPESQKELASVLKSSNMEGAPVAILGNKSDLKVCAGSSVLQRRLT
mmetsp:Transcript_4813/g.10580  ORF Transcript_4813/g.10580 Transcript_4813/m.10580 type:complete len:93 (-) Transcript_4813:287-565(-)